MLHSLTEPVSTIGESAENRPTHSASVSKDGVVPAAETLPEAYGERIEPLSKSRLYEELGGPWSAPLTGSKGRAPLGHYPRPHLNFRGLQRASDHKCGYLAAVYKASLTVFSSRRHMMEH